MNIVPVLRVNSDIIYSACQAYKLRGQRLSEDHHWKSKLIIVYMQHNGKYLSHRAVL